MSNRNFLHWTAEVPYGWLNKDEIEGVRLCFPRIVYKTAFEQLRTALTSGSICEYSCQGV